MRLRDSLLTVADAIRNESFLPDASQLLDSTYSVKEDRMAVSNLRTELLSVVDSNIERCERKLGAQNREISQAKKDLECRKLGDLITINAPNINPGQEKARLVDYFDASGGWLEVRLDPRLSPYENAQRYFSRYSRAKRALSSVSRQIRTTRAELDYLEQVAMTLEQVDGLREAEAIRAELIEQGYLKETSRKKVKRERKKTSREAALPSFSIEGYEVIVGRNNKENDHITMKVANADDIWMHARGIPGAHVIVKAGFAKGSLKKCLAVQRLLLQQQRLQTQKWRDYGVKSTRKSKGKVPVYIYDHEKTITRPVFGLRYQAKPL